MNNHRKVFRNALSLLLDLKGGRLPAQNKKQHTQKLRQLEETFTDSV